MKIILQLRHKSHENDIIAFVKSLKEFSMLIWCHGYTWIRAFGS